MKHRTIAPIVMMTLVGLLSGCARLDHLGSAPTMTPPGNPEVAAPPPDPNAVPSDAIARRARLDGTDRRVAYESYAGGLGVGPSPNLWDSRSTLLFADNRARYPGDIVTVEIEIDDEAQIRNRTDRSRDADESLDVPNFFGVEQIAKRILPDGSAGINPAVGISSGSDASGQGSVSRNEKITLKIAALVRDVLPNGNLVIQGSQEIRVNFELRDLQISGIVRPQDITRSNSVQYEHIAEARVSYGGRGQITDVQQPRYGQQVLDMILPF
jgi:flagellar L-ring protein FlgH